MGTKTISLKIEAYDKLRAARRYPSESFSEVVLRATWPEETVTARKLLERHRSGPHLTVDEIRRVAGAKRRERTPVDKWAAR